MAIVATVVLAGVVALWLYAIRRDPDPDEDEDRQATDQKRWILGGGIALPTGAIIILLIFGIPAGHRMAPLFAGDQEVLRIDVTAHQWWWEVEYPTLGLRFENELHIPAGVPVEVRLRATDVVHAFWVPRLGGKLDAIPGHTNVLKLEADEAGLYHGQCAEFCGLQHARMHFTVAAYAPSDFDNWLQEMSGDD